MSVSSRGLRQRARPKSFTTRVYTAVPSDLETAWSPQTTDSACATTWGVPLLQDYRRTREAGIAAAGQKTPEAAAAARKWQRIVESIKWRLRALQAAMVAADAAARKEKQAGLRAAAATPASAPPPGAAAPDARASAGPRPPAHHTAPPASRPAAASAECATDTPAAATVAHATLAGPLQPGARGDVDARVKAAPHSGPVAQSGAQTEQMRATAAAEAVRGPPAAGKTPSPPVAAQPPAGGAAKGATGLEPGAAAASTPNAVIAAMAAITPRNAEAVMAFTAAASKVAAVATDKQPLTAAGKGSAAPAQGPAPVAAPELAAAPTFSTGAPSNSALGTDSRGTDALPGSKSVPAPARPPNPPPAQRVEVIEISSDEDDEEDDLGLEEGPADDPSPQVCTAQRSPAVSELRPHGLHKDVVQAVCLRLRVSSS